LRRLPPGQDVLPWRVSPERSVSYSFDAATQAMRGRYVEFTDGRGEYRTMPSGGCGTMAWWTPMSW
jgi:hypothetical protein